jgi:hypothetical protein
VAEWRHYLTFDGTMWHEMALLFFLDAVGIIRPTIELPEAEQRQSSPLGD